MILKNITQQISKVITLAVKLRHRNIPVKLNISDKYLNIASKLADVIAVLLDILSNSNC